jgi:hypothetical protein
MSETVRRGSDKKTGGEIRAPLHKLGAVAAERRRTARNGIAVLVTSRLLHRTSSSAGEPEPSMWSPFAAPAEGVAVRRLSDQADHVQPQGEAEPNDPH